MLHINPLHEFQKSYLAGLLCKFLCSIHFGRLLVVHCVKLFCCCSVDEFVRCAYFPSSLRFCTFLLLVEKLRNIEIHRSCATSTTTTWDMASFRETLSSFARAHQENDRHTRLAVRLIKLKLKKKPTSSRYNRKRVEDVVEKQTFVFCD